MSKLKHQSYDTTPFHMQKDNGLLLVVQNIYNIYMHVSLAYECLQYTTYIYCVSGDNPICGLMCLGVSTQMQSLKT